MNYGLIKNCDVANGEGVRVTLFVSGCRNHCPDCFQPETWDFYYGNPYIQSTEQKLMDLLKPSYIRGLTILGGEPFEPENQETVLHVVKRVREELPEKDIWIFTGFTFEELHAEGCRANTEYIDEILSNIDILVDGRFDKDKKNLMLKFRGSENQRIIDMKETVKAGEIKLSPLNAYKR